MIRGSGSQEIWEVSGLQGRNSNKMMTVLAEDILLVEFSRQYPWVVEFARTLCC